MNAQMFLCVTASSWQKDLLLEMWCFAVWVQREDQEHREKARCFQRAAANRGQNKKAGL